MSEISDRRFHRIFARDGRSVIAAMDHGMTEGLMPGFEEPEQLFEQVIEGGADAVLTTVGMARKFGKLFSGVGLLIRCDGATSPLLEHPRELVIDIETVLELGADAAAAMYFPGIASGHASTIYFPRFAAQAHRWGVPVMAEALPYGFEQHPDSHAVDAVASTCRMAFESGADIIKTYYTGERTGFEKVTQTCGAPVLVLGGVRARSDEEFLAAIRDAMDAGARGVVIGRNIWQAPSPVAMTRALHAIVHQDASVADALTILRDAMYKSS